MSASTMDKKQHTESLADQVASFLRTYGGSLGERQPISFNDLTVVGQGSGVCCFGIPLPSSPC